MAAVTVGESVDGVSVGEEVGHTGKYHERLDDDGALCEGVRLVWRECDDVMKSSRVYKDIKQKVTLLSTTVQ